MKYGFLSFRVVGLGSQLSGSQFFATIDSSIYFEFIVSLFTQIRCKASLEPFFIQIRCKARAIERSFKRYPSRTVSQSKIDPRVNLISDCVRSAVCFKQHSIHVYALSEGASYMQFAVTVGEKKIALFTPGDSLQFFFQAERLGFLYNDKNIETCEKRH